MNKADIKARIETGNLVECTEEDYPLVRTHLQQLAGEFVDGGQGIKAMIALQEVQRLDTAFNFKL